MKIFTQKGLDLIKSEFDRDGYRIFDHDSGLSGAASFIFGLYGETDGSAKALPDSSIGTLDKSYYRIGCLLKDKWSTDTSNTLALKLYDLLIAEICKHVSDHLIKLSIMDRSYLNEDSKCSLSTAILNYILTKNRSDFFTDEFFQIIDNDISSLEYFKIVKEDILIIKQGWEQDRIQYAKPLQRKFIDDVYEAWLKQPIAEIVYLDKNYIGFYDNDFTPTLGVEQYVERLNKVAACIFVKYAKKYTMYKKEDMKRIENISRCLFLHNGWYDRELSKQNNIINVEYDTQKKSDSKIPYASFFIDLDKTEKIKIYVKVLIGEEFDSMFGQMTKAFLYKRRKGDDPIY